MRRVKLPLSRLPAVLKVPVKGAVRKALMPKPVVNEAAPEDEVNDGKKREETPDSKAPGPAPAGATRACGVAEGPKNTTRKPPPDIAYCYFEIGNLAEILESIRQEARLPSLNGGAIVCPTANGLSVIGQFAVLKTKYQLFTIVGNKPGHAATWIDGWNAAGMELHFLGAESQLAKLIATNKTLWSFPPVEVRPLIDLPIDPRLKYKLADSEGADVDMVQETERGRRVRSRRQPADTGSVVDLDPDELVIEGDIDDEDGQDEDEDDERDETYEDNSDDDGDEDEDDNEELEGEEDEDDDVENDNTANNSGKRPASQKKGGQKKKPKTGH